jgi:hypothetical protein
MGWGDLDDSDLLWAMHGKFDVLITVDKSIPHQQAAARKEVAVIVMRSIRVRLPDLLPFVPTLLGVLDEIRPGEAREIRV